MPKKATVAIFIVSTNAALDLSWQNGRCTLRDDFDPARSIAQATSKRKHDFISQGKICGTTSSITRGIRD